MSNNLNNPWISMWVQPKATIKKIVGSNPKSGFFFLSAIWFLQFFFSYRFHFTLNIPLNWIVTTIIAVILSPFIGAIAFYIFGWFLYILGKALKGKASQSHVRCAFAWSRLPLIINLILWVIIVFFIQELFKEPQMGISLIFIYLITWSSFIWSFVLLVAAIKEIQKFSNWKAFFNVILAYFFAIIVFLIVNQLIF